MTSVCWTSYADPESLVTVGPHTVALLCQNVVIFHNVKTQAKHFYKGDGPETSAGISLLAGHPHYPLFAIAEEALRPSIYVMNYPEMEKLTIIPPSNDLYFVDLHLSEHLIAVTGAPDYTLKSWNYRTGVLHASKNLKPYGKHCMYPLGLVESPIVLYSAFDRDIVTLETCPVNDVRVLHEILQVKMGSDYEKSTRFNVAWLLENAYVVNDYGVVSIISLVSFAFLPEWRTPQTSAGPKPHRIFHRSEVSLLVANDTAVYCIKKQPEWVIEWQIESTPTPVLKMVTDFYGNVYAASSFGRVYYVDNAAGVGSLRDLAARNCKVLSYCLLRGIKEEVVLLLTDEGELRLVDVMNMNTLSSIYIDDACCMESHNNDAFVAVGTTKGTVHFVSYEKHRQPLTLGSVVIDNLSIAHVKLFNNIAFVVNEESGMDVLICNYQTEKFRIGMSLEREQIFQSEVVKAFLLDGCRAALFVSQERAKLPAYVEDMWLISWRSKELFITQQEFLLPHRYRDFTLISPCTKETVKFMCLRVNSSILDMVLLKGNRELVVQFSIRNRNYEDFNRISGTGDVLASAGTGIVLFPSHKWGREPYCASRLVLTSYVPHLRKLMDVCFKSKFLMVLYSEGHLMVFKLTTTSSHHLMENEKREGDELRSSFAHRESHQNLRYQTIVLLPEVTHEDIEARSSIIEELKAIRQSMRALINEDIAGTGQSHGVFRKFCVNTYWLACLTANAKVLCKSESDQMMRAIEDRSRIRNWMLDLIRSCEGFFSTRLHSFFSSVYSENYASFPAVQESLERLDKFLMNDFEREEREEEELETRSDERKPMNHFKFEKDQDIFEFIMSHAFDIQDIHVVSNYQMYSEESKLQIVLINAMKEEFNRKFATAKNLKHEIIDYISRTNGELEKIYSNMNCVRRLLSMKRFEPPALFLPEWKKEEFIERIITVDDSEITAINPRRLTTKEAPSKRGRMLLWPDEFFSRAIMHMMDGVLEKLWEEEIKKIPKPPKFLQNKRIEQLAGREEQEFKEYQKTLAKLEVDRRKYLRILQDTETKTVGRKNQQIAKLNETVAETAVLKLKYDFAIKRERLCLLNTKKMNFERIQCKRRLSEQRDRLDKLNSYTAKYGKLLEFWTRTFSDLKVKLDTQTQRDRQLERQFKVNFINSIPAHLSHEMNKIYKRRPKLPNKALSSASVSNDVHERIMSKRQHKFPLPDELNEFLSLLDTIDDAQNCPFQLDHKHWEQFTKLRRQRLESEIRLKAIGYSILDAQLYCTAFSTNLNMLKQSRSDLSDSMSGSVQSYFDMAQDRFVVVTLSMGQLEANVLELQEKTITVLHVDDLAHVNDMIKEAGKKKIAAMQRVAFFRRQVVYKEWEHQVMRANIQYLNYVLKLVQNCQIPYEVLDVCRTWNTAADEQKSSISALERELAKKRELSEAKVKKTDQKIEKVRAEIRAMRASNNSLDRHIEGLKFEILELNQKHDPIREEKMEQQRKQRYAGFLKYHKLVETVRRDYVQILELTTILELQRLRTYPTLKQ